LTHLGGTEDIPVNANVALLVPYRGKGGPSGGSFRYISAQDVLLGKLPPNTLKGQIALVGSSAPALEDLRVTPMSSVYPGVEVQANLVAALAERHFLSQPDYTLGFEVFQLLALGLLLLLVLPRLSALGAIGLVLTLLAALWLIHDFLFTEWRLVLPSASAFSLGLCAYIAYSSYGFFVEGRRRRRLVRLFGSYVAPERVDQMMRSNQRFSMAASHQVLTVMFCDMRGFTKLAQNLPPLMLQSLLNDIFTKLSAVILQSGGTIDKYMGDCVMAFWGAPEAQSDHAARAVHCAVQLQAALDAYNHGRFLADPQSEAIQMGVGLHTGLMCVGDMGSMVRRSYTVIGDAVNIASRLEGLCKIHKVPLVVSRATKQAAEASQLGATLWAWRALGSATIDGTETAIDIYTL
jgi:adenylate cyclase